MANIPKIKGIDKLLGTLRAKQKVGKNKVSVIVGYSAAYAVYVHENKEMKWAGQPRLGKKKGSYWDPQGVGQSKFLERPAREFRGEFIKIIRNTIKKGGTLLQGLYVAGLFLQRKSQQIVPVDLGNLKASAFTVRE
tara:strand:+ start:466 stop:873 length:408 start_codon:yes stop_codon:yes gene_type:complete